MIVTKCSELGSQEGCYRHEMVDWADALRLTTRIATRTGHPKSSAVSGLFRLYKKVTWSRLPRLPHNI